MFTEPARVRFAPSPTGRLHIGGGRTALYNYLIARQSGGQFILRLEDTDRKRYQPEAEQEIMDGLRWLGLDWDEGPDVGGPYGPYRQSERKALYLDYAQRLIEGGHAYHCFCTPKRLSELRQEQQRRKQQPRYDGLCRNRTSSDVQARLEAGEAYVIRFHIPNEGTTTVRDHLRGEITFENKNLDDYIIVKSDGYALYHLAVVVDDHLMKISHVIRTAEWLPTFPLHVRIYEALGWEQPTWIHPSIFLKPSGKGKMSKRESAAMAASGQSIFLTDLKGLGYLPQAVVNWIALMGWSYDDKTEFFSMPDLVEKFSIDKLNPSPAAINFSKFDHFNGLHIRSLPTKTLGPLLKPYFEAEGLDADDETLDMLAPILQERLKTLDDAPLMAGFFFQDSVSPGLDDLVPRGIDAAAALEIATRSLSLIQMAPRPGHVEVEQPLRALAEELGLKAGQVFGVLRGAVTGQRISPPLFETMEIVGKETVVERIENAIEILESV